MGEQNVIQSITLFYPSKILGGAEYLFIRFANECSSKGIQVVIIDYEDGFIKNQVEVSDNIRFIIYKESVKIDIDYSTHIITPISNINSVKEHFNFINEQIYIFFWSIHPYNIVSNFTGINYFLDKPFPFSQIFLNCFHNKRLKMIRNIILTMSEYNLIAFMDGENFDKNKMLLSLENIEPTYLPIFTYVNQDKVELQESNILNFAWFGRLSVEKTPILIHTLKKIDDFNTTDKNKIKFFIIGDGSEKNRLLKISKNFSIDIIFLGTLNNFEAKKFLRENVSLVFAMGTSALDTSGLGIPTILLDYSYKAPKENYKYKWIFETLNYNLGIEINGETNYEGRFLGEILREYGNQKEEIADKCLEYVLQNHSVDKVVPKIIENLNKVSMPIKKYMLDNDVYNDFSFENRFLLYLKKFK